MERRRDIGNWESRQRSFKRENRKHIPKGAQTLSVCFELNLKQTDLDQFPDDHSAIC